MQKIYYGAPGTGKSFEINEYMRKNGIPEDRIFRTTFHPEYSYSDFVGQLLPTIVKGSAGNTITYSFQKGIFTRAVEKAYIDTSKEVFLIIEEMSRGNCAAIFGDIFQLLDREKKGVNKGYSRYFICNEVIAKDIIALTEDRVKLPPNLSILGTVNTSDQNVFAMDTAFKRRFEWQYISTKPVPVTKPYANNIDVELVTKTGKQNIKWTDLYGTLNRFIADSEWLNLGEDKQIGQFFVEFDENAPYAKNKEFIRNKLLHYLWEDVEKVAYKNEVQLFADDIHTYLDLYDKFETDDVIFSDVFLECITKWKAGKL